MYFDLYPHHGVKFKSVLIYIRIAKPFVLPLQMFAFTKIKITFCKTRTKLAASVADWRLLTSPIVEKKHVHFPTVNSNSREKCIEYIFHDCFQNSREKCIGSPNPLFYRCKFSPLLKQRLLFAKLERKQAILRRTGGS